jgi:hypothetical protein
MIVGQSTEFSKGAERDVGGHGSRAVAAVGAMAGGSASEKLWRSSEHRLKPVLLNLRGRTVFADKKIFGGTHFLVACRDEPCILRMRTHFTQRASENR